MKTFHHYTVTEEQSGISVEAYLKEVLNYSGRKLQKLTRQKGITVNNKPAYLQRVLKGQDRLGVLADKDAGYGVEPEPGQVEILYEDDYLTVLNKPAGLLVHPAGRTTGGTLANYLAYEWQQRGILSTIRPVHRLDRDTSGCIIFAKDSRSQSQLEQQLKARQLTRRYCALANGHVTPPTGTIDAPIGAHPTLSNRRSITPLGEQAVTRYEVIREFTNASLLELILDTGRTHQIRLHLAHIGHPVIGDRMYGQSSAMIKRQALHAQSVRFLHLDSKQEITVSAPLPADFEAALSACTGLNGSLPSSKED